MSAENHKLHPKTDFGKLVPFGLKDGVIYEPKQVENGLACGCICPSSSCNAPLEAVANKTDKDYDYKVVAHFRHAKDEGCVNGRESAIHLAAKQLIEEHGKIFLPAIVAKVQKRDARGEMHQPFTILRQQGIIKLQSVRLEESVGDFKPDLIAIDENGVELLIEIAVTSFVGEDKLEKVKSYGRPLVEINASEVPIDNFKQLAQLLFKPVDVTKFEWKYHPDEVREELRLTEELNLKLKDIEIKAKKEDELRRFRQQKAEANRKHEQEKERQRIAELEEERLEKAKRFKEYPEAIKLGLFLKFLNIDESKIPWFLNYKVHGENSFGVARKTWQLSIFGVFIQRSEERKKERFSLEEVAIWVNERFVVTQEFSNSDKVAIWGFLDKLSDIGVLEHTGRQWFEIREDNLEHLIARRIPLPVDISKIHLNNVEWVHVWPNSDFTARIAKKYERKHYKICDWGRIAGLFPIVRDKALSDVVNRYIPARNDKLKKLVLEFMVEARYICLKNSK